MQGTLVCQALLGNDSVSVEHHELYMHVGCTWFCDVLDSHCYIWI